MSLLVGPALIGIDDPVLKTSLVLKSSSDSGSLSAVETESLIYPFTALSSSDSGSFSASESQSLVKTTYISTLTLSSNDNGSLSAVETESVSRVTIVDLEAYLRQYANDL